MQVPSRNYVVRYPQIKTIEENSNFCRDRGFFLKIHFRVPKQKISFFKLRTGTHTLVKKTLIRVVTDAHPSLIFLISYQTHFCLLQLINVYKTNQIQHTIYS